MSTRSHIRRIPLRQTLFLDLLMDRTTRRIFIYMFIMIAIGATMYHDLEGWDWLDSFYFVVVTLTTIGYGDFVPTLPITKVITIFYGLNGVILLLTMFDVVRRVRQWEMKADEVAARAERDPAASGSAQ